ncbi:MAG: RES family NAD+ phosphorylase [Actinomycetota bacterium]
MHKRRYRADDPGGARKVSGRYNRGLDRFDEEQSFAALYLATAPETCLGEVQRHVTPELLPALNDFRLSELSVEVGEVADCRSPKALGLSIEHLVHDTDYEATQAIGAAALERGLEGLIVPSATRLGDNLVLFPESLRSSSRIEIVSSRDPRLR